MTIEQFYDQVVRPLPTIDRLQLATLILGGILPEAVPESSDQWSDEDLAEFSRAGWIRIES